MASTADSICKALRSLEIERDSLPIYDEESIQTTKNIIEALESQSEGVDSRQAKLMLQRYSLRLQEGINIYTRSRFSRIVELRGSTNNAISDSIKRSLSPREIDFINSYTKVVAAYKKALGFDPTVPAVPPKGLNAEVTVIKGTSDDSICVGQQWMVLKENEIITLRIDSAQELESMGYVRINEYLK